MLEFPEVATLSSQLQNEVAGKTVEAVLPPTKPHKFCWFMGDPASYEAQIRGCKIQSACGFGIFVGLDFDNGKQLCFNDGVSVRLIAAGRSPKDYQLLVLLSGGAALVFTVAMYGGILLHDGGYDDLYYRKSLQSISPLSADFSACFSQALARSKPNLSLKAFLATEQRFPGIGNGVSQDILFAAGLHPRRKLSSLGDAERARLKACVVAVLREMTEAGGRDTEKDLYGKHGGYRTKMSRNGLSSGCPVCGGSIVKEAYLGGSVYFCPRCQPLTEP